MCFSAVTATTSLTLSLVQSPLPMLLPPSYITAVAIFTNIAANSFTATSSFTILLLVGIEVEDSGLLAWHLQAMALQLHDFRAVLVVYAHLDLTPSKEVHTYSIMVQSKFDVLKYIWRLSVMLWNEMNSLSVEVIDRWINHRHQEMQRVWKWIFCEPKRSLWRRMQVVR